MTNETTKHTPVDWHRNIKPARKYTTIFAGQNTHVAHLSTRGWSDDELEAHANLIAAAPDLLAAVEARNLAKQEARAVSEAHPDGERIPAHIMARVDQLFAKADTLEAAALAKARGEG